MSTHERAGDASTEREPTVLRTATAEDALDALLRRNPDALVAAVNATGALTELPASVRLHGQRVFEGGSGMDLIAAEDRVLVLAALDRAVTEPVVAVDVHLLADPDNAARLSFFDVRAAHGVYVSVLEVADVEIAFRSARLRAGLRRRVAQVERDGFAVFTKVDDEMVALLGWTADELVGMRTLDLVHPDDLERAIEGWMAMRAGVDTGRARVRLRHADGHHLWLEVTNENQLGDPDDPRVVSQVVDISAEMAHLEALSDRERLLARLAEALPIGICHLRGDGEVLYANEPLLALLGPIESGDALVRSVADTDRLPVALALDEALMGRPGRLEVGVQSGPGELRCEITLRPMTADAGGVDGVIVCASDITEASKLRAELEHRASHDALSGCLNRTATIAALERCLRTSGQVAVAYIDLDHFKGINDELGHAAGDEVLRIAAARLRAAMRSHDVLGRMGGDEFVVVCPQGRSPLDAAAVQARLTEAIEGEVAFAKQRIALRASVGVTLSTPGDLDAEGLLNRADAAMYTVKRGIRSVLR